MKYTNITSLLNNGKEKIAIASVSLQRNVSYVGHFPERGKRV